MVVTFFVQSILKTAMNFIDEKKRLKININVCSFYIEEKLVC